MAVLDSNTGESVATSSTSVIFEGGRADIDEIGVLIDETAGVEYEFGVRFYSDPSLSTQVGPDIQAPSKATGLAQHAFPARGKYFEVFATNLDTSTGANFDYVIKAK